jgi:hypothetical protein
MQELKIRHTDNSFSLSDELEKILNKRPKNIHFFIFGYEQPLFQLMAAKYFFKNGFNAENPDDLVVLHFFETHENDPFEKAVKFKLNANINEYFYFEDPLAFENYIKLIKQDAKSVESKILAGLEIYALRKMKDVKIKYFELIDYNMD